MNNIFNFDPNRFYPHNFIVKNCDIATASEIATQLSDEAKNLFPDNFTGTVPCFTFELRYCPPYEQKSFRELMRLQSEAICHTRFKNQYCGFILLDLSEWVGHFHEELFSHVTLSFLAHMSDRWKYLFFLGNEMVDEASLKIITEKIWAKELSAPQTVIAKKISTLSQELHDTYDIGLTPGSTELLGKAIEANSHVTAETIGSVAHDISAFFGRKAMIDRDSMATYMLNSSTFFYSLLSEEDRKNIQKTITTKEDLQW